jgi:hypothetical protein
VDNVGVRSINEEIYIDELGSLSAGIGPRNSTTPNIHQILFLEVNARSDTPRTKLDDHSGTPDFISMINIVTSIPIDQTTSLSTDFSQNEWQKLASLGGAYTSNGILHAEIDFDLLPDTEIELRNTVKKVGSGFDLQASELEAIESASWSLLKNNPCFKRFVGESGAIAADYVSSPKEGAWNGSPYGCHALNDPGR